MSALDPRTPTSDLDRIAAELREVGRRLDLLEAPTGTSAFRTVERLTALVEDIQAQLADFIANDVGALVTAAVTSALAGNISIGGSLTVAGAVTMPGVRNTDVTMESNRVTVWVAGNGKVGHT